MIIDRKVLIVSMLCFFAGCASAVDRKGSSVNTERLPTSYALKGTSTAVVGIAIDDKGYPLETVKEIILKPGQRAIFAGPDEFQIIFKDKKIPNNKTTYRSVSGTVTVDVPKDILDRPEFREEFAKTKQIRFNYAIRVKDRELDPPFIIKKDD